MNSVVLTVLLCAVLGIASADSVYGWRAPRRNFYSSYQEYKRPRKNERVCLPWRSPCTHDDALLAKYDFLYCCSGMTCKCTVWGNNCRCESKLG